MSLTVRRIAFDDFRNYRSFELDGLGPLTILVLSLIHIYVSHFGRGNRKVFVKPQSFLHNGCFT